MPWLLHVRKSLAKFEFERWGRPAVTAHVMMSSCRKGLGTVEAGIDRTDGGGKKQERCHSSPWRDSLTSKHHIQSNRFWSLLGLISGALISLARIIFSLVDRISWPHWLAELSCLRSLSVYLLIWNDCGHRSPSFDNVCLFDRNP
jgi:hypothetical protein